MIKKIVLGALLGGITLFLWGMVSWMMLPWHNNTIYKFTNEDQVRNALRENTPIPGVYVLPNFHADGGQVKTEDAKSLKKSFFMFASVRPDGASPMGRAMGLSLLFNILAAGLATWLLLQTNRKTLVERVRFVKAAALFVGCVGIVPGWIWWRFAGAYTLVGVIDLMIGWGLAGAAIHWALEKT